MANLDSSNKKWASMSNDQKKSVQDALSRVRGNGGGNETPQQALQRIASQGYYTPKSAFEINTNPFTGERNANAGTAFNDYLKQRQAAQDRARQQAITDLVRNQVTGRQAYNEVTNILQQNQERKNRDAALQQLLKTMPKSEITSGNRTNAVTEAAAKAGNTWNGVSAGLLKGLGAEQMAKAAGAVVNRIPGLEGVYDPISSGLEQEIQKAQRSAPNAFSAGNVAGNIMLTGAIGGAVKLPNTALGRMASSALTFGGAEAVHKIGDVASGDITPGRYAKSVAASAAGGGIGGLASGIVGTRMANVLRDKGMMTPFMEFVRQTATGTAFGGANLATNQAIAYATNDDSMKLTRRQAAEQMATVFGFSMLNGAINTLSATMQAKAALQQQVDEATSVYEQLTKGTFTEEEYIQRINTLMEYTDRIRSNINSQYLAGNQNAVNNMNDALDVIQEGLRDRIGNIDAMRSGAAAAEAAGSVGNNILVDNLNGEDIGSVGYNNPVVGPQAPTSGTNPAVTPSFSVSAPRIGADLPNLDPEVATLAANGVYDGLPSAEGFESLPDQEVNDALMNLAQQRESIREQQRQALYDAGKNQEQNIQPLMESATMLSQEEKLAAIRQGNADAAQAEIEMIRQENLPLESAKENFNVRAEETGTVVQREGSERNLAVSTGESTAAVPRGAGETEEDWRNWSAAADKGIESVYGRMAEATQAESLIRTAEPGQVIHYVPEDATPAVSKGVAMARSYGVDVKPFVSGSDIMVEGGESVRAFADPLTRSIGFKANDEAALGDQLVRHELIEFGIMDNKVNVTDAINHLKSDIPEEFLSAIASVYIPKGALDDLELIDDPMLKKEKMQELYYRANKEMLCDVGAGINQLKGIAGYENLSDVVDEIVSTLQPYMNERLGGAFDAEGKTKAASQTNNQQDAVQQDKDLKAVGISVDRDAGVAHFEYSTKFSWKTPEEIEKAVTALQKSLGVDRESAESYVNSELSLTNLILSPANVAAMDFDADNRYTAIKKNSDYPQGTVDFNNNCRKRVPFTTLYDRLQKRNPNRVFTAEDLEIIRQEMIKEGYPVACAFCYVEERRQRLGEIAQDFVTAYSNGDLLSRFKGKPAYSKIKDGLERASGDDYTPTIADLLTYDGLRNLDREHKAIADLFKVFNNARGMQSGRLVEGRAEYKREILTYTPDQVKKINDEGGLRIFSYSDFEAVNLLDLVQIIQDAATVGLKIQAYTKVPAFAKVVRNTGIKLNRSLIPKGTGIKYENGHEVLDLDTVEGIDVNDPDFFDSIDDRDVGNVIIGMSDEQIELAMNSPMVDYIIPFHTNLSKDILKAKNIAHWKNYKNFQNERVFKDGKLVRAPENINIYTDVLQAAKDEGSPIKNRQQFVEKFLQVAKDRNLTPRFAEFLDVNESGDYVYTPGYEKFLLDFKLFDKNGKIVEQKAVRPVFDDEYNTKLMNDYAEGVGYTEISDSLYRNVVKALNEKSKGDEVHYSTKLNISPKEESQNIEKPGMNVSYSLSEDGDRITISPESYMNDATWKRIHNAFNRLGYGMPSVDITKKYVLEGYPLQPDQTKAVKKILGLSSDNDAKGVDIEKAKKLASKAARHYGTTTSFNKAAYITVNGSMLDFSEGQGYRTMDHRQISEILDLPDDAGYSDGMIEFMNQGNIRMQTYGVDISVEPNAAQRRVLTNFIHSLDGEFTLDISNENGYNVASVEYPEGTRPARIFADIDRYFKEGIVPQDDSIANYHMAYSSKLNLDGTTAPTFYSKLQREINNFKGDKIGAASVESYLKGKGVKDEEIKWSGIRLFLDGKKSVGKQELVDYLKANELQLETKVLSSDVGETMYEDGEGTTITRSRLEELAAYWTDDLGYDSYKIVPHGESADDIVYYDADGNEVDREKFWYAESKGNTHWSDYKLDGGENYREILFRMPNSDYSNRAMQTHWGESGVLAHARIQDFNADNGKRILFVEEIQSDWHNAGHQYGYGKDNIKEKRHTYLNERTNAVRTALLKAFEKNDVDAFLSNDREQVASIPQEKYFAMLSVEDKAQMKWNANNTEKFETISKAALDGEYAPDAPFKQNYTDFVLKDLLRVAAEDDYDYLAWTTADMQSRRWSGEYAEGYRIEYDQEIPGFLKKYGKQWKAGLTSITLDNDNSDTVPAITVNDEMKHSVLYEGQPMFSTKLGLDEAILNDTFPDWEEAFNAPKDDVMDVSESRQQFMQSYADSNDTVKALNVALGRSLDNKLTVNADASKVANSIVKKYRSGTDADKVSSDIEKLYESLGNAAKDSVNKIATAAADIGAEILDGIKTTDKTMQDSYPNLKKELKSYKLTMSDQDKNDVGSAYDGFNNFRKKMFGKLTLVKQDTKGAVPVDTAYQELSEKYPDLFPDDIIAPSEQMVRMAEVANSLKATKVHAVEGMDEYDYEMQAYVIGQEILKDYYTAAGETGYGKVFDAELAKVRQKYEKQIQRLKASNNAKVDRVKQKYEDRIAKANARRKLTKTGNDLLKEFRKLKKMKGGPEFEAAKQALIGDFDLYSKGMRDDTKLKLEKLRDEAEALKEKDVNYANSNYDKDFKTFSRLNQKHIKNLSLDEMEDLIEAAVELRHAQEIQNKVLKDNKRISAATIARRGIEQQRKAKSLNKNNELGSLTYRMFRGIEGYNFQSLSAVRALRAMDGYRENGVLSGIGKDLNDGYIRSVDFEMKARKSFEEFTNDKKFMDSLSKPTVEIKNPANGKTAMITPGMRMAVYLMSKDPDNRNHIKSGGLCIPNVKLYTQRAGKEAYADDVRFRLEYTDLQEIYSGMTDREKAFADRMFQFYNGGKDVLITTKDAMNETSMLLNGHEIAFSDNHYPISTNKNFIQGGAKDKYQNPTIEGGGFLKERKVNASNPIYLEDATDVLNRSINNVKNYYGLAVPIRNANAILNFTESGFDTSLRQEIDKAWKGFGLKIIDNIIDDLNAGGRRHGVEPGKLDKFQSRYVTSVFGANAGVAMKQFSSYLMALAYLHPDSMLKGLNLANRVDLDYIDSITPLHWARRKGMSGTELGEVYDYRQGVTGKLEKGANRLTNGITHVDVFTTKRLISASIAEMKKYHPEFKEGTPEYDAKLAELINNVFQLTQPSYDVLHRSEYQRSTGDFARIMSMFSTASLNMSGEVADAFGEFRAKMDQAKTGEGTKADARKAASRWAKVLNAYILAQVSYTAIGALWNLALHKGKNYRDEKGEITAESFIKKVGTDAIENIIGGGFFGGKQVVGIATLNWDDMVLPGLSTFNSTMNDITDFIEQFGNVLTGKETDTSKLKKVSFHLARDLGAVGLGLPINTFYNFANAGKLWIDDIKNGKLGTWDAGEGLFGLTDTSVDKKEYAQQALSAIEDGNQEKADYAMQNTGKEQLEAALGAESQKKENGKTIKDSKRMDALKKIDEMNISDTDKAKLASRMYDFEGVNGDNWKEYISTLEAKMNGKQEGVIEYLSTADISEEERRNLWENACGYSPKTYEENFGGGETEAETEAETEPETEAEIPVETEPETEVETVPETEPETEAVKPSGSGAEIESEITEGSIEGDARYAYIVDAVQNKKHSAEEAVAWYNSDPKRVNAGKYIAWTNAGGSTYDYIKTRSDLSKFKGNGKQEKIANYILNQGYSEDKQRVIWFDICDYSEKNWNKYFNSNRSWQDAGAYLNQRKRQVWYSKPGEVEVKKGDPLGKLEGLRSHIKEQASTVAAMAAMAAPDRETRANIIAKHFEKNVTGFNLQDIFDMQEHNFPSKVVYAAFKKLPARTQYAYIMENWPRWAVKEYEEGYESDARDFTRPNANELREFIDKRWKLFEAY